MSLYGPPGFGGGHEHADPGVLTVGCHACVARVSHDQEKAEIDTAPLRRVTWTCGYQGRAGTGTVTHELAFSLVVKVPAGRDGWWCDEQYCEQSGGAFFLNLPDTIAMFDTGLACESMSVLRVTVGNIVPDVHAVTPIDGQTELFAS